MTIPTYLPYFIAAGTVAVLITIFYGLNRALADAHWPAADRTRTLRVSAVILLGWLAAAITLSAMGIYHVTSGDRPTIQYGILLPILIGALMIWRSEAAKRVIACRAATVACRRAALSRARRDFSDPLRHWQIAWSLCLACRPWATSSSASRHPLWVLPMRERRTRPQVLLRRGTCLVFSISLMRLGSVS